MDLQILFFAARDRSSNHRTEKEDAKTHNNGRKEDIWSLLDRLGATEMHFLPQCDQFNEIRNIYIHKFNIVFNCIIVIMHCPSIWITLFSANFNGNKVSYIFG